jgi:protein-L-isoaspartate O-methyltransferase
MQFKQMVISALRANLPPLVKRKMLSLSHAISEAPLPVEARGVGVAVDESSAGGSAVEEPPVDEAVGDPPAAAGPLGIQVIRTLDDLDRKLKELDRAAKVSDDALRQAFHTFRMDFHLDTPSDPWSRAYRDHQFKLYEYIAGKPYDISNEVSAFNVEHAANVPFPYNSQSCQTVGNHLISIGFLVKTLNLPPGSTILEFGAGWGNTTEILARMGHRITAVDIEKNFTDLIDLRAKKLDLNIQTICDDFACIEKITEPVDVVLFFECFHHCSDHLRLLEHLDKAVADDGMIVFAAEPITKAFPIPWGLRMDGESLWAIRNLGWLELGFNEEYFTATLDRFGWSPSKHTCTETPWGTIITARRKDPV